MWTELEVLLTLTAAEAPRLVGFRGERTVARFLTRGFVGACFRDVSLRAGIRLAPCLRMSSARMCEGTGAARGSAVAFTESLRILYFGEEVPLLVKTPPQYTLFSHRVNYKMSLCHTTLEMSPGCGFTKPRPSSAWAGFSLLIFHHSHRCAPSQTCLPVRCDNSHLLGAAFERVRLPRRPSKLPQTHFQRSLTT